MGNELKICHHSVEFLAGLEIGVLNCIGGVWGVQLAFLGGSILGEHKAYGMVWWRIRPTAYLHLEHSSRFGHWSWNYYPLRYIVTIFNTNIRIRTSVNITSLIYSVLKLATISQALGRVRRKNSGWSCDTSHDHSQNTRIDPKPERENEILEWDNEQLKSSLPHLPLKIKPFKELQQRSSWQVCRLLTRKSRLCSYRYSRETPKCSALRHFIQLKLCICITKQTNKQKHHFGLRSKN